MKERATHDPCGDSDSGASQRLFEVVEHTADWAIRVRAPDFAQLLHNAAVGMASLLVDELQAVPRQEARTVQVEAFDRESMLVEWLGELAYLAERDGLVFPEIELEEAGPELVRAHLRGGRPAELLKHIKAVTYHNLEVVETPDGLEATIVFDV